MHNLAGPYHHAHKCLRGCNFREHGSLVTSRGSVYGMVRAVAMGRRRSRQLPAAERRHPGGTLGSCNGAPCEAPMQAQMPKSGVPKRSSGGLSSPYGHTSSRAISYFGIGSVLLSRIDKTSQVEIRPRPPGARTAISAGQKKRAPKPARGVSASDLNPRLCSRSLSIPLAVLCQPDLPASSSTRRIRKR